MFVHTVGNPDRTADIAAAVLADDEARAEVVAPVVAAVMRTTGLPAEQQPLVASEVDRILRDPDGARTFIDPFVGSWATSLGIDDDRSTQLDVSRLVALSPALAALQPPTGDLPLPQVGSADGVPLLAGGYGWVGGFDRIASASIIPLSILAVVLAGVALAIGDRRRTLRRFGGWAVLAGAIWVVLPPIVVWAARRWVTGADAVVKVAVGAAMSGLTMPALVLVLGGAGAITMSFGLVSNTERRPGALPRRPAPPSRPVMERPRDEERKYAGALAARAAEAPDDADDDVWSFYGKQ